MNDDFDFEPETAFSRIDCYNHGSISTTDLTNYVRDNFNFMTNHEAQAIISQYDSNFNGLLSYNEWLNFSLSQTRVDLRNAAQGRRRFYVGLGDKLPYGTEKGIISLLLAENSYQNGVSAAKDLLKSRYDYATSSCFALIDRYNDGFISR